MKIKKIKIEVLQDDINAGYMESMTMCPIAIACKRVFPNKVIMVSSIIKVCSKWEEIDEHYYLPNEAIQFISDFDNYGTCGVKPFTFEVEE